MKKNYLGYTLILILLSCSRPYLKKDNPSVSIKSQEKYLLLLVLKNNFQKAKQLIDTNISFHNIYSNRGNSALHFAVRHHDISLLKYLIEKGGCSIDINHQNKNGNTPLHLAVLENNLEAIKFLLQQKSIMIIKNKHGSSAFDYAIKTKVNEIIKAFIEKMYAKELKEIHQGNEEALHQVLKHFEDKERAIKFAKNNGYLPESLTTIY